MSPEEAEAAIVALRDEVEELQARVAYLEARVADGHDCTFDLCELDESMDCVLVPRKRLGWDE